jgi:hypothetical protein
MFEKKAEFEVLSEVKPGSLLLQLGLEKGGGLEDLGDEGQVLLREGHIVMNRFYFNYLISRR